MTLRGVTNHPFVQTAQPASPTEGLITAILPELLEYILIYTNQSENTRLVSRHWNVLTFTAFIKFKTQELKHTIQLITEQLDPDIHAQRRADLVSFQNTHHFDHEGTFAKVRQLFLADKGLVIGMFRKLPDVKRDQLQIDLGKELPDSMKNLFKISKLSLFDVPIVDRDTFFTLLKSCEPLSMDNRYHAIFFATQKNYIEFVKLLLADGPISDKDRQVIFLEAASLNHLEVVKLLLANGPISETTREIAIREAVKNNYPEIVQLLRKPLIWRILAVALKIAAFVGFLFAGSALGIYAHEYFSKNRS